MTEVHFEAGVMAPLRLRAITEEAFRGYPIFRYELSQSQHQGELARAAAGLDSDEHQAVAIKGFTLASRQPIEGLGVGRYYTLALIEHEAIPSIRPAGEPGEGLLGLLKTLFQADGIKLVSLGDLLGDDAPPHGMDRPEMTDEEAAQVQDYIASNFSPDQWAMMGPIERAAALSDARRGGNRVDGEEAR